MGMEIGKYRDYDAKCAFAGVQILNKTSSKEELDTDIEDYC